MRLFIIWLFNFLDFLPCPCPSTSLLAHRPSCPSSNMPGTLPLPAFAYCYHWMLFSPVSASGHCITFFLKSHLRSEGFHLKVQSVCPLPRSISNLVLMIFTFQSTFLSCLLIIVHPSSLSNRM